MSGFQASPGVRYSEPLGLMGTTNFVSRCSCDDGDAVAVCESDRFILIDENGLIGFNGQDACTGGAH